MPRWEWININIVIFVVIVSQKRFYFVDTIKMNTDKLFGLSLIPSIFKSIIGTVLSCSKSKSCNKSIIAVLSFRESVISEIFWGGGLEGRIDILDSSAGVLLLKGEGLMNTSRQN